MKAYKKGADKEREIMNKARSLGFLAFRSAGSHSPIDVFILCPDLKIIKLIQSKPESMSQASKDKLEKELKEKYDGFYRVGCFVE